MNKTDFKFGDKVAFKSYTFLDYTKKGKGVVMSVNTSHQWRGGYTTVVHIKGDDDKEYTINAERVEKA